MSSKEVVAARKYIRRLRGARRGDSWLIMWDTMRRLAKAPEPGTFYWGGLTVHKLMSATGFADQTVRATLRYLVKNGFAKKNTEAVERGGLMGPKGSATQYKAKGSRAALIRHIGIIRGEDTTTVREDVNRRLMKSKTRSAKAASYNNVVSSAMYRMLMLDDAVWSKRARAHLKQPWIEWAVRELETMDIKRDLREALTLSLKLNYREFRGRAREPILYWLEEELQVFLVWLHAKAQAYRARRRGRASHREVYEWVIQPLTPNKEAEYLEFEAPRFGLQLPSGMKSKEVRHG